MGSSQPEGQPASSGKRLFGEGRAAFVGAATPEARGSAGMWGRVREGRVGASAHCTAVLRVAVLRDDPIGRSVGHSLIVTTIPSDHRNSFR